MALELNVGGGYVLRRAIVNGIAPDRRQGRSGGIGGARILRKVVDGSLAADSASDSHRVGRRARIDLVIEDGDNPPLELIGVSAIFAELPWIYFEATAAIVAKYGNGPAGSEIRPRSGARLSISTQIADVAEARWGDPRPIAPAATTSTAPASMPTGGAPIDVSLFRFIRALPEGEAELIAVPLDAAVLAHSSGPSFDFADVRVVDSNGRQVPYVVERRDEPLTLSVVLEQRSAPSEPSNITPSGTTTYYRVRLPMAKLPPARLILSTSARVFDRTVQVAVERPADSRQNDQVAGTARNRTMGARES